MLKKGDRIGLITPSGFITDKKLIKAEENLKYFGLEPFYLPSIIDKFGYFAGRDNDRISEIHEMYRDNTIKAILCVRGGYGVTRILDRIDYRLIKENPKPMIGFSDITALLSAIYKNTGIPGFHGIVGASKFTEYTRTCFEEILMKENEEIIIQSSILYQNQSFVFKPGIAEGIMIGGNLSLLTSLIGTDYDIDWSDKIIYIEEINEPPYKIDRMLTHLISAGKFKNVKAVIFGIFNKCNKKDFNIKKEDSFSLKEVISERFEHINVPSVYGFSFGHIEDQAIFPFGSKVRFDAEKFQIYLNKQEFADFF